MNEIGFRLFGAGVKDGIWAANRISEAELSALCERVVSYISKLKRMQSQDLAQVSAEELREAKTLANRLTTYVQNYEPKQRIIITPGFRGCGILQACSADFVAGSTIYEIKAGDRDCRLVDVRQLITYCALNYEEKRFDLSHIGLLNPRIGLYFRLDLESFLRESSGKDIVTVTSEIVEFLSRERSSR